MVRHPERDLSDLIEMCEAEYDDWGSRKIFCLNEPIAKTDSGQGQRADHVGTGEDLGVLDSEHEDSDPTDYSCSDSVGFK